MHSEASRISSGRWWPWVVLLVISACVRGGTIVATHARLQADPDAYRQIAQGWLATGVMTLDVPLDQAEVRLQHATPTAYRPPLYPWLLTWLARGNKVSLAGIAALHFVLGLATVAGVYHLGLRWWEGSDSRRLAFVAGLVVALDPILLHQSTLVMTETLATFLAVVCFLLLTRLSAATSWRASHALALACGVALGIASLCRPTFLPWLGLICVFALGFNTAAGSRRWTTPALIAVGALLVLAPWGARNQRVFGRPILTTTHGGYTLWLANNAAFYDYLSSPHAAAWEVDTAQLPYRRDEPPAQFIGNRPGWELEQDRRYKTLAINAIRQNPALFVGSSLVRIGYFWSPLPQRTASSESTYRALARYAVGAWYLGVYLAALAGAIRLGGRLVRPPWLWGLLLCVSLTAIHAVYFSNLRMRAPVMPVVALLAACAIASRSLRKDLPP
jgi:4-amino-4-deoxy-L-arabinose transferase-like glycosyltransferase